jgi:spore coat polysaccharide biosynthesis protein SpsF
MKTGFLITARLKSTRLPGKLRLKIDEREIIRSMIDRLKLSNQIDEIILCTSTNPQDEPLEHIAKEENIECYRGHEEDVIQRLSDACEKYNLDYVLNVTADCPLVSYEYFEKILDSYHSTQADFIRCLDLPIGFFSYGIKPEALKKACSIKDDDNTEVWGRYFTDTGLFKVVDLNIPDSLKRSDYRLTLDYPDDFQFFETLFASYGDNVFKAKMVDIILFLDSHPEIVAINATCQAAYKKNWNTQNKLYVKNKISKNNV